MCCLFGLLDYSNTFSSKNKNNIISALSIESEARGKDATGIAYNANGQLSIYKRALPAHKLHFAIPKSARYIMGHTRMTTQGSEKLSYNNHPFLGTAQSGKFALAHNGILYNDISLKKTEALPQTNIQTDSFVAVQLIEKQRILNFESLAKMAEKVEGSFTFTVLDSYNNVPYAYQLQIQHYMAVTGLKGAYIAVLLGGNSFRYCFVERDDELIEMVIKLEKQFWDYVESNTPPSIDGSDAAKDFINSLFPVGIKNRIITLDETCLKYINDFENSHEQEKRYCKLKEQASNELKQLIGDCEQARIGDRHVTWRNIETERLDIKRLLNDNPEIYQKYLNKSTYRRFSIK